MRDPDGAHQRKKKPEAVPTLNQNQYWRGSRCSPQRTDGSQSGCFVLLTVREQTTIPPPQTCSSGFWFALRLQKEFTPVLKWVFHVQHSNYSPRLILKDESRTFSDLFPLQIPTCPSQTETLPCQGFSSVCFASPPTEYAFLTLN